MRNHSLITLGAMICIFYCANISAAFAQWPMPPPFQLGSSPNVEKHISPNDKLPPKIEFLTPHLYMGKNVFSVRITDDSSVVSELLSISQAGHTQQVSLVRGNDASTYKSLVDVNSSRVSIIVSASDAAGNTATKSQTYLASSENPVVAYFLSLFDGLKSVLQGLVRQT